MELLTEFSRLPLALFESEPRWGHSMPIEAAVVVVLIFGASILAVRGARWYALRKQLLDVPNSRSSHKVATPRLGGVGFVPVLLIAGAGTLLVPGSPIGMLSVFLGLAFTLGILGFCDDLFTLSSVVRLAVHSGAALLTIAVLNSASSAFLSEAPAITWITVALVSIWIVGLLNAYNFMDGIDGIAGVQGVIAGCGWGFLGLYVGAPVAAMLGFSAAATTLGFLICNWPPAKIFMGDTGSTVLGYYFAVLPFLIAIEADRSSEAVNFMLVGLLFVWPFVADTTFTFFCRLWKGENVFEAHRRHLYQRMVSAGKSHRYVVGVYGGLALATAPCAAWLLTGSQVAIVAVLGWVGVFFGLLVAWTFRCEKSAMR